MVMRTWYIGINAQNLYIYWHKYSCHDCGQTDGNVKVEQYSAEAESATRVV